jgi:hypothetical protein
MIQHTPVIDHQLPGDGPGNVRAEMLFDHGQRQVDPGCHHRWGPHRPVDDEVEFVWKTHPPASANSVPLVW